jgi:uncharacterized protein with HEPN domain
MTREYNDYLNDIFEAVLSIEEFVKGMTFEEFEKDKKTFFAVIRAFEVLGEAAKKIPQRVRQANPAIPWREMAGMRDKLIHEYFAVDARVLSKTIHTDIPRIKQTMRAALPNLQR